jgi:coenzyme PQQ synthesis protein D (PqqD)
MTMSNQVANAPREGVIRARLTSALADESAAGVVDFCVTSNGRTAYVDSPDPHPVVMGRGTRCTDSPSYLTSVTESAALQPHYPLPHPSPSAIFKELDEGGVLLSTSDEVYFGVNPVGARIWALLPPVSQTFGELCRALEQQYPEAGSERIRVDAQEFLEALITSGLVVTASN